MDRRLLLAAILTTVAEVGEAPEGVLYAGVMGAGATLEDFQCVASVLASAGYVETEHHVMRATDKGRALAGKLNAAAQGVER